MLDQKRPAVAEIPFAIGRHPENLRFSWLGRFVQRAVHRVFLALFHRSPLAVRGHKVRALKDRSLFHRYLQTGSPAPRFWRSAGHEKAAPEQPSRAVYARPSLTADEVRRLDFLRHRIESGAIAP